MCKISLFVLTLLIASCGSEKTSKTSSPGKLYVTNSGDNTISIIDLSTNTVTKTITAAGTQPGHIVYSPASSKVFMGDLNAANTNLQVISTSTEEFASTINTGDIGGMDINTVTDRVYALDTNTPGNTNIHIINAATNAEISSIAIGTNLQDIRVDSTNNLAYITDFTDGLIVMNTTNNSKTTFALGTNPHGLALDSDANLLYVTDVSTNDVLVWDTAGNTLLATIAVGNSPQWVALSGDKSKVYVTNDTANTVSIINTTTRLVTGTINVGTEPFYVLVDALYGRAYVTNISSNNVSIIDTTTDTVIDTITVGTSPVGLTIVR